MCTEEESSETDGTLDSRMHSCSAHALFRDPADCSERVSAETVEFIRPEIEDCHEIASELVPVQISRPTISISSPVSNLTCTPHTFNLDCIDSKGERFMKNDGQ